MPDDHQGDDTMDDTTGPGPTPPRNPQPHQAGQQPEPGDTTPPRLPRTPTRPQPEPGSRLRTRPTGLRPNYIRLLNSSVEALLDVREDNYRRHVVTDAVNWPGRPPGCVVSTYVPRPEAVHRIGRSLSAGRRAGLAT